MFRRRSHIGVFLVVLALALPFTGVIAQHFHEHLETFRPHAHAEHSHRHAHDTSGQPAEHDHEPVRMFLQLHACTGARHTSDLIAALPVSDALPAIADGGIPEPTGISSACGIPPEHPPYSRQKASLLRRAANLPPPPVA